MRNKLLLAGAVIAVAGGGVASAYHYNSYQTKRDHDSAIAAQVAQDKENQRTARLAKLEQFYAKERLECEKGQAAYAKLTLIAQKTAPNPVCGPAVIQ